MKKFIRNIKNIFRINDNPISIAKGFGLGSFIGMLPIPGFQVVVSLGIAQLFKANKKAAALAVFNTNLATGPFIFAFNYWLGKQLLGFESEFTIPEKINIHFLSTIIEAGSQVMISLTLGGVITGMITGLVTFMMVKSILANRTERPATFSTLNSNYE